KDGALQPGRGSLAEVLPASLIAQFATAGTELTVGEWRAASGVGHRMRRCAMAGDVIEGCPSPASESRRPTSGSDDFARLVDAAAVRTSIVSASRSRATSATCSDAPASARLVGTLAHRLIQRLGLGDPPALSEIRDIGSQLLRGDEHD